MKRLPVTYLPINTILQNVTGNICQVRKNVIKLHNYFKHLTMLALKAPHLALY